MAVKIFRYIGIILVMWVFYMGFNIFQLLKESHISSEGLHRISDQVTLLKRENENLRSESKLLYGKFLNEKNNKLSTLEEKQKRKMLEQIDMANLNIKELKVKLKEAKEISSNGMPSINYEILSRRILNQIREMWFLVSGQVNRLEKLVPEVAYDGFKNFLESFREINQVTERDLEELTSMDGVSQQKDALATELSKIVQQRLHNLQNPKNCNTAKKLVCSLNKGCGYGCQMHHVLYCFIIAYSTGRTLIINSSGWRYSSKGWNGVFESVSDTCTTYSGAQPWGRRHDQHQVVNLPIVDAIFPRPVQMPLTVPRDLYERLRMFSKDPFIWWIGQFCKYLFRYKPHLLSEINEKKKKLAFQTPIVGIQVRRTDKINLEAAYHDISEYMYWVELYYKKLELAGPVNKKRVFIASDDASVLHQAREKYPEYEFISDSVISRSAKLGSRYSDESLHGVITDIELLSQTDFLVCTFSSQVCRLAYEIMNNKHTDATQNFRSLDDIYYFGGQHEHRVRAIWPHIAKSRNELDLQVGDTLGIAGNHWNGQAKGLLHGKQKTGLFPAFKVENIQDVEDFPIPAL